MAMGRLSRKRLMEERKHMRLEEAKRIAAQRQFFTALPDALKKAMLERAWVLLDAGQCEACDALLEFLPEEDVRALLDEYFEDESSRN